MSEVTLQWLAIARLLVTVVFAGLYGFGGIKGKWKRRYIASFVLACGVWGFALIDKIFSWWLLLYYPLLVGALSLGYGADKFWQKVLKRGIYGLALGFSAIPIAFITGQWLLFGYNIVLCISVSILCGVFNPVNARNEETIISAISGLLPLFMV